VKFLIGLYAGLINAGDEVRPYIGFPWKHNFVWHWPWRLYG